MSTHRTAIRFICLTFALALPITALAGNFEVKALIDIDDSRSTGCTLITPGGIVTGIDAVLTTAGTVSGSTGSVTAVTRQTCSGGSLGLATAVDAGGWNVGVSPTGDLFIESHYGRDLITMDNIGTPRFVFTASTGTLSDVVMTPYSWGGGDVMILHAARDHAVATTAPRTITLDGDSSDWAGAVPLANGTQTVPAWRFISALAYAGSHDLFFAFSIHTNPAAPTAIDDHYALSTLGGTLTVATLGVQNNDIPNFQPVTSVKIDNPQHGTVNLAPDGGFTYVHDGSLANQDQFHYVLNGTTLQSNIATVTIDLPGNRAYAFTSANNTTFVIGQFNSFEVTVSGKPTPALTEEGNLPAGVSFTDNGNGTGTLSGTPGPNTSGSYDIVFHAEKNKPHHISQNFNLSVVCPGITITNPAVTTGTAGAAFSQTFTQSGAQAPFTFTLNSGVLPTGLSLSAAGVLSGTPTQSGAFPITVKLTDNAGCVAISPTYNLVIACHTVTVTNPATSNGTANAAFSQTFTQSGAIGGATFTLNSGSLPSGLALSTAGVLSGTPTQTGSFPITVKVTDGQGCVGIGTTYNLVINCQTITVTNPATTTATVNVPFSQNFTAGNTIGVVTFTLNSGTLPTGLTLSTGGVLSGTPTQTGSFPITVKATDANSCFAVGGTYTLVVGCQVITVNNPSTNTGTVNIPFSQNFTAGNAIAPVTFTLNSGTLPAGITLSSAGALSGTPTQTGSFPITVKATDANGCFGISTTYTLTISCQVITVNKPVTNSGTVNVPFSQNFTSSNTIGTVTYTTASTLPTGITLAANGTLSGTPTQTGTFGIVVTATDANGCTGSSTTYSLTINCQVITVNNPATTSGQTNVLFSQNFTASNTVGAVTFATASTLPTGFSLAANGLLSGTTTQSGSFPIVVTVTDGNNCPGTGATYNLVINDPPAITSANSVTFKVGTAGTFTVTTTGFPTGASMAISETGALPAGVTFVNNNNGTATLAGTPNAGTGGTYPITITANNGIAPNATQNFTLTVNQSPAITSGASTTFKVGQAGTFSVTTTGFPTGASMVISQTGPLPGGVTFVDNGNGTATLAGTPNAGTGGTYPITITANNGVTPNATQNFTLTVQQAPAITSASNTTFTVGAAGTFTVTTTGFPSGASMVISETGALPGGVTFVNNNDGTATLAGAPSALTGGVYSLTIGADNGVTPAASQNFTLTVNQAPAITSGNAATFKVGQAGTFTVTTTGFPSGASMVISETGALPGGVSFVNNNDGTATLAGTPNALTGGVYSITITANNGVAPNATQNFTLTVNEAPQITSANQATFPPGVPTTFTVTTTGFPTNASMVISETGDALPGTVTFTNNNDGTATIAGTATGSGDVNIVITASNGVTPDATQNFTIHRTQPPSITSANNATFKVGVAGTFTVTTTGFPTGASMVISESGSLPANVTFTNNNDGTATIAGTPAALTGGTYPITITANNGIAPNATQNFTLTVQQPPVITSANNVTFTVGAAGTFTVTTTGFPTNVALSETGGLPLNVTFTDNGNGTATLAGTPAAGTGGTYPIVITGNNGVTPNATQNFTLTVNQAPAITSANTTTFQTGVAGTFTVTTTGFPTNVALSKTGALPLNVTFTDNGDGTATIAGTPNAGTGGSYPIVITGNNGVAPNATQNFTLVVNQPPAITSANNTTFKVGSAGTFTVTTTGFPTGAAMVISETGALPSGVTFVNNNNGTATLAGTPDPGTGGTYSLTIGANNGVAPNASQSFTLTVQQAPSITSTNTTTFQTGVAGTFTVTTTGFPTNVALSKTGALPLNVTFTDNGDGTATIAGTPNAGTGGSYPIVITGNNGVTPNATQNFTLVVNQPPAITSANNTTFKVGAAGTFTVTTTGFPTGAAMVISETGALPSGVTFVNNNNGTATLAGTPDPGTGGTYSLTIGANNGVAPNASQSFTLTVQQAPSITSTNTTTFQTGVAGTFTVTTTGFPTNVALSKTGALPLNVTFTDNGDGTATIAGTPNAGTGGSYPIVITGNNGVAPNATQNFTFVVNQPPAITSVNNATFTVGAAGTFTVTTSGFPTAVALSKTGALPLNVTFTDNGNGTATLAGTPAAGTGGTYPIVITGNNGVAPNATQNFTLTVNQAPAITSANTTTFQTGVAGTFTVTTTGFPASVALSKTGALPLNVTFTDNGNGTATIAGTPNAGTGGSYPIVITGNNGVAPNATQNFTLVVNQPPAITSANNATFKVGVAGTFSVTTTGFPTGASMVISETGALPSGVTFVNNNNGTATLAGTPGPGTGGTYSLTIGANNGVAPAASQSFTLTVQQAPAITSGNAATFTTGQLGTFSVTTTGFPVNVALSKTGSLPASISFTDNGNGTATISGTPGPSDGGSYPIVITGNNGVTPNATQNFTLTINQAPAITSANNTTFTVGSAGTFTVTTTGFPTNGITRTGTLPSGVTFTDNGNNTATIAGTPAAGTASGSPYAWVITAANGVGTDATQNFTFNVVCPAITVSRSGGGPFPAGVFNSAYSQSATASGGTGPYTFAVTSGSLPTGLSLASGGAISGTPTATGLFNFTITATDTVSLCSGSQSFSISIAPVAVGDSYPAGSHLVDNTQFVITGGTTGTPATPAVTSATNILTNDLPSGGVTATPGTFATTAGGSVTIAADGTFIYTPKVNSAAAAITSDSFTYTVVSNGITSAAGTVNLTLANRVWYVKNNGGGTNGQSQSPFTTLAAAQAASVAGDIIFVYNGDGLTTGQSLGITLKNNQQLIGEGVALVVNTVVLKAAGTKPQITNTAVTSDVVTLADGNTVNGLTVTAATRDGIAGLTHAGFTGDTLTIQTSTSSGLHLTSMTGTVTLTNTTFSGANGTGLDINNGTAIITLDNTNSITANAGKRSVSIQNRPAAAGLITIGAGITDNGTGILVNNNASGTIAFTGTQTLATTTNPGVTLTTNTGTTINFSGTLNVTTTTGSAFNATGNGTLNVTGTANITTGAATTGVNINGVTVGASGVTFTTVNTTGATTGVSLTSLGNGNVTINGGTISGGTTGLSLSTLGTSTITLGANAQTLTFTGSTTAISGGTFGTLAVAAGSTVNVSGVSALNLATGVVSGTFANVTSSGGTNGVNLSAVTGTWGVTAGTLTGATGSTFNATGTSTGTVTWGGVINQANAANVVTISGTHTGTINFTGNVTTSAASTGINISASSGTYNFSDSVANTSTLAGTGGAVTIFNEGGSISFGSGYAITNASPSFKIGGTATNTTANITYSGTMAPLAAGGVLLDINSTLGTYSTGTITFNGTTLGGSIGNPTGVRSVINSMTGTLVANHLSETANNNGYANTLLAIGGTNTGGSFTFNNLVLAANGTGHTGNGLTMSGGGTLTITATGGNSSIDAGGVALDLNGVALGASAIQTLNSTGGANGIKLTSVTGGTLTITGGAISGNTTAGFSSTTSTATLSYGGTIANNTARVISVSNAAAGGCGTLTFSGNLSATAGTGIIVNNCNAGTMLFSAGTKSISTGVNAAVTLTNNTGATINFTGGGLALTTTTGNTFTATGGGTVTVTGANNTATSTTGTAVNITSTTIGAGNVIFKSVSANGGSNGIILNATGASGSMQVTGDGTLAKNNSGGTIQNLTGVEASPVENATLGVGIYLNNTKSPSFNQMHLTNFSNYAVAGTTVNGFNMSWSIVDGTNGTGANRYGGFGEGSVIFQGLTGSPTVDHSDFSGGANNTFLVLNNGSQSLNRITVTNCSFAQTDTTGSDALTFQGTGGTLNVTVQSSTFTAARGDLFQIDLHGTISSDLVFGGATNALGNTMSNSNTNSLGGGITLGGGGASQVDTFTFNIDHNTMQGAKTSAISIGAGTGLGTNHNYSGTINGNTIGVAGTANSGSFGGSDISVIFNDAGTGTFNITNNILTQYNNEGVNITFGAFGSANPYVQTTVTGNTISNPGSLASQGVLLTAGTQPSPIDTGRICFTLGGAGALANAMTGSGANGSSDIRIRNRFDVKVGLPGYGGATTDVAASQTYLSGRNGGASTVNAAPSLGTTNGTTNGFFQICPP